MRANGKLRIEMVVPAMPVAGLEMVVANLTRRLRERGHEAGITCVEFEGALGEQLRREGMRVSVVPTPGLRTILKPTALEQWFREIRPDVVHVHSGAWLKAARAARAAGVPRVVHTVHGLLDREPWYGPALKRWAARDTDGIAAVSQPLVDYMRTAVRLTRVVQLLPNGIDTDRFSPGPRQGLVRDRFGLADDRLVIGIVARFAPVKNHALLLDAFARVQQADPRAFLALVGEGPLEGALREQAAALGITGHVGFYGLTDDAAAVYREFDVFVLSSVAEGTSMSILEAMASGLPIVATDVGGNAPLLDHGRVGRLVPSGDAPALAAALLALLDDAGARASLGQAARARALEHYGVDIMTDRYLQLYGAPESA